MLSKQEIIAIVVSVLILGFTISLIKTIPIFLIALLSIFLIILVNLIAKKITSHYLDSEIEISLWRVKHWGFKPSQKFSKSIPAGAIFPIILTALTGGLTSWLATLTFEVKAKTYRAAKRFGLYSFTEMSEFHIGLIAASGIIANLLFSIIGYLLGFETFAKLNVYYAFFNMLPISDLDGNKLFFGSLPLWLFLFALTIISLGYTIRIV